MTGIREVAMAVAIRDVIMRHCIIVIRLSIVFTILLPQAVLLCEMVVKYVVWGEYVEADVQQVQTLHMQFVGMIACVIMGHVMESPTQPV